MMSGKQPKEGDKRIQFTPALEKLFNRICARVYRGNPRKRSSRDKLLSVQHSQIANKSSFGTTIATCRPTYQGHNSIRGRQFVSETASYFNPSHQNIQMKKLSTYLTERQSPIHFDRPFRCKTQSIKFVSSAYLPHNGQNSPAFMVESDMLETAQYKNKQGIKNRPHLKTENQANYVQAYSQIIKPDKGIPSKWRQMEGRRKKNTIVKANNKLAAELGKHEREQSLFFKPWDVEPNDQLLF